MPILFASKSHGQIPVGFFNIETDMLLMDRYFFFATDFCEWVIEWIGYKNIFHDVKPVYAIQDREMIGNLSDAIHGYQFTGFIGEVYKCFPFPDSPEGFKQKPYGTQNRPAVERTIRFFAARLKVPIIFDPENLTVNFGDYQFSAEVFQKIIGYIESGGMPGWLNGRPPEYVHRMVDQLLITHHPLFKK